MTIDDDTVIGGVPKDRRHFTSPDGNVAIRLSDLDEPYQEVIRNPPASSKWVDALVKRDKRIAELEAKVQSQKDEMFSLFDTAKELQTRLAKAEAALEAADAIARCRNSWRQDSPKEWGRWMNDLIDTFCEKREAMK